MIAAAERCRLGQEQEVARELARFCQPFLPLVLCVEAPATLEQELAAHESPSQTLPSRRSTLQGV